jgi:hypothetical protein
MPIKKPTVIAKSAKTKNDYIFCLSLFGAKKVGKLIVRSKVDRSAHPIYYGFNKRRKVSERKRDEERERESMKNVSLKGKNK